ncbi:hypothetical protein L9G16_11795 [Shewanella sp. A25]|nr:hypothetical protein [Shewanella shenzhenensis]
MGKIEKEKVLSLKFIQENPQASTKDPELNGYLIDDLIKNGFVIGIRSNELGQGLEPIYFSLQITTAGREYLESRNFLAKLKQYLYNPYIVGITCTILGAILATFIS